MPCDSSYMGADHFEKSASQVQCLLDELAGLDWKKSHWEGYHPEVYCKGIGRKRLDEMVAELCGRLGKIDVTQYSLEMQMWWRDHQRADQARRERERQDAKRQAEQESGLSKLTDEEREALGL